jgi:hypothetical protein
LCFWINFVLKESNPLYPYDRGGWPCMEGYHVIIGYRSSWYIDGNQSCNWDVFHIVVTSLVLWPISCTNRAHTVPDICTVASHIFTSLLEKWFIVTPAIHFWYRLINVADTKNELLFFVSADLINRYKKYYFSYRLT